MILTVVDGREKNGMSPSPSPSPSTSPSLSPPPSSSPPPSVSTSDKCFAFAKVFEIAGSQGNNKVLPKKDVWVPLRDVRLPAGVRLDVGDVVRFDMDEEKLRALPPISVVRLSPHGSHTRASLHTALADITAGMRQMPTEVIPNAVAIVRAASCVGDSSDSLAKSLVDFLTKALGDGMCRPVSEAWARALKDGMLTYLLANDGPILKGRSAEWMASARASLLELVKAACRRRCGIARGLFPCVMALARSGCSAEEIASLYGASHPPSAAKDPLELFEWDELPLVPTHGELRGINRAQASPSSGRARRSSEQSPMYTHEAIEILPTIKTHKPYDSVEEYLETYFRLYRADCFTDFSKYVDTFLQPDGAFDPRDMAVFTKITLGAEVVPDESRDLVYTIRCQPSSSKCVRMANLSFGNLLGLSLDGSFEDVIWMTLVEGPENKVRLALRKLGRQEVPPFVHLAVRFCTEANGGVEAEIRAVTALGRGAPSAVLVENPVFFTAYEPVLATIRDAHGSKLPFEDELVRCTSCSTEPSDAAALLAIAMKEPQNFGTLDPGQKRAYEHFAKNRFSVIQGPPGTGKSYLGVRIAYSLVKSKCQPIVVMSYKNHSLDEFILDMQSLGISAVVRLGHSPKMDERVAASTMENLKEKARGLKVVPSAQRALLREATAEFNSSLRCVRAAVKDLGGPIHITLAQFESVTGEQGRAAIARLGKGRGRSDERTFERAFDEWARPGIRKVIEEAAELSKLIEQEEPPQVAPSLDMEGIDSIVDEEEKERKREEEERMATTGNTRARITKADWAASSEPTIATLALHYNAPPSGVAVPRFLPSEVSRRAQLIRAVLLTKYRDAVERFHNALADHYEKHRAMRSASLAYNAAVIKAMDVSVICCTVVGAAIHHDLITQVLPKALVIEEAAEIPEPALISAMFPSLQRVVQIGDHKQLRASTANYDLAKRKHLDVSGFERFVNCGLRYESLSTQNRMAPDLLGPVHLHYQNLDSNLAIVGKLNYPPPWLSQTLFWWNHAEPETKTPDSRSKSNRFEAERAVMLTAFLLHQSFKPESLVVITPYIGQLLEIRARISRLSKEDKALGIDQVRSKTVDEFQGDEAEIVILSLVRSSAPGEESKLGFLTELNRQIVATSRHKLALVIIGNSNDLSRSSEWRRLIDLFTKRGGFGNELPLTCPRHGKTIRMDRPLRELSEVTGCGEVCAEKMECGHLCKGRCHGPERRHRRCTETQEVVFQPCGHKCICECGTSANSRCYYQDVVTLPCGHKRELSCWQRKTAVCIEPCDKTLPCGHRCSLACSADCTARPCRRCVDEYIEELRSRAPPKCKAWATVAKEKGKAKGTDNALAQNRQIALQATVRTLGIPADDVHFWESHVIPALRNDDFWMASLDWSLGTLDQEGRLEMLENYEEVVSIILAELGIRVPKSWGSMPQVMPFVALMDVAKPGVLDSVRTSLGNVFRLCDEDSLGRVASELPAFVRQTHDAIYNFILGREGDKQHEATRRYGYFLEFRNFSMEKAAQRVTDALEPRGISVLSSEAIEIGRAWGLFGALPSESSPNSIPPPSELPKCGLYSDVNNGREFVSVDLRRADFAILRLFNKGLVVGCAAWEEFVTEVLKLEARERPHSIPPGMENFRGIRTRLLGKLAHRKNAALQSHVLRLIARAIVRAAVAETRADEETPLPGIVRIFRFSCDELVIQCAPGQWKPVQALVADAIASFLPGAKDITRVEAFRLHKVPFSERMISRLGCDSTIEDNNELLKRGHPALMHGKFQEPEFVIDPSWEDSPHEIPRPEGVFFVRCGLSSGAIECKCLPTSFLVEGHILALRQFRGELFVPPQPAVETPRDLEPSPAVENETGSGATVAIAAEDPPCSVSAPAVVKAEAMQPGICVTAAKRISIVRPNTANAVVKTDLVQQGAGTSVSASPSVTTKHAPSETAKGPCCEEDELESAIAAVKDRKLGVNSVLPSGKRALALACKLDLARHVKFLLSCGADPKLVDPRGKAAIHFAAEAGSVSCLRLLIESGKCDVRQKTKNGTTAAHYAKSCGHVDCAKVLANSTHK